MWETDTPPDHSRPHPSPNQQPWHPAALRKWNLALATFTCWTLIAVLQYLLSRSQRDKGVIFSQNVNDLPLQTSFWYLYFPTILAVIFSIYWAWIDQTVKRLEPYYQLSKNNGALGKDSLLLHYPMDFIPAVPFLAFKRRHWLVFLGSTATVLIMIGLVPAQAGIFSTWTVTRSSNSSFLLSQPSPDMASQPPELTLSFTTSTYGIIVHNETLPPYMTRTYALRPFSAAERHSGSIGNWTAQTTLYSLDMSCEAAQNITRKVNWEFNGTECRSSSGAALQNSSTPYSAWYENGRSLSRYGYGFYEKGYWECGRDEQMFVAAFAENSSKDRTLKERVTAIFCKPHYYQQQVTATIDIVSKYPVQIDALGPKQNLSSAVFNMTSFRDILEERSPISQTPFGLYLLQTSNGGTLPMNFLPSYRSELPEIDFGSWDTYMGSMAAVIGNRTSQEYLDPAILQESYSKAYQLFFARAMADVLQSNFNTTSILQGKSTVVSEAVVLEPVFVYVVEALLGIISLFALALLYLTSRRGADLFYGKLHSDPGSIAAIMALTSGDQKLLSRFQGLDKCNEATLHNNLSDTKFKLAEDESADGIITTESKSCLDETASYASDKEKTRETGDSVRPVEFHLGIGVTVVGLFASLFIALAVLFAKSKAHGLPLPSRNKIVQSLIRSYLPTAVATLIEPLWILVNRLLCVYQPFQELITLKAKPARSIGLNYSSLPPQLTLFKALSSRHFMLASVCAMALLANLLATAFAGILFQDLKTLRVPTHFYSPFEAKLMGPPDDHFPEASDAHFMALESNYTQGTLLPPWTDEHRAYSPIIPSIDTPHALEPIYEARTKSFEASLDCQDLTSGLTLRLPNGGLFLKNWTSISVNMTVQDPDDGRTVLCGAGTSIPALRQPCVDGQVGVHFSAKFMPVYWRNMSEREKALCESSLLLGWARLPRNQSELTDPNDFLDHFNAVGCQPRLVVGDATVVVDPNGNLQEPVHDYQREDIDYTEMSKRYLYPSATFITGKALNRNLIQSFGNTRNDPEWHCDSYAYDALNYFLLRETDSTRFLDANQGLPRFPDVVHPLQRLYARLFAIWLAINRDNVYPLASNTSASTPGYMYYKEERLLFKTPLFIISEIILGIYIVVTLIIYSRRPGRYLPYLPVSIAAIITYFAASTAVQDLQVTAHMSEKDRGQFLEESGFTYGYGSYVGPDGRAHVGIERAPFVTQKRPIQTVDSFRWWQVWRREGYHAVRPEE